MANDSAGGWVALGLLGLAIYSCSGTESTDADKDELSYAYAADAGSSNSDDGSDAVPDYASAGVDYTPSYAGAYDYAEEEREPFDEDAARDAAEDEVSSETYRGIGRPYGCTDDCSGHEAGFAWRRDRGYVPSSADSPSFRQGAQAYEDAVEERVEEMRDDYDAGEDPDY